MPGVFVVSMAPRKTRTLRLSDGGLFRIGPGTVSVPVSTVPLDPPAVLLHINRSCGALELEPDADGTVFPPVRVDAKRALEIVSTINSDRATAAMRGERAEPLVELPPTFKGTARHVAAWQSTFSFMVYEGSAGYPGRTPETAAYTLWVTRATGECLLEFNGTPKRGSPWTRVEWKKISPQRAVDWLEANGYRAIPATLHRLARKGAQRERPRKRPTSGKQRRGPRAGGGPG
jgi:hypothetical protein